MDVKEIIGECLEWIELTEDRDRWWAFVNMVMNFWVLYDAENFLTN